jgi:hypothetical protein
MTQIRFPLQTHPFVATLACGKFTSKQIAQPFHVNLFMWKLLGDICTTRIGLKHSIRIFLTRTDISYIKSCYLIYFDSNSLNILNITEAQVELSIHFHTNTYVIRRSNCWPRHWVERLVQDATTRPEVSETERVGRLMRHYVYPVLRTKNDVWGCYFLACNVL